MGEVEEQRFVCKFCNKSCLSGKSLGGHMRSHLALIAAAKMIKLKADNKIDFEDDVADDCGLEENPCYCMQDKGENCSMNLEIDDQDQEQDSHVLRQNPKKSWKISDLRIKPCQTKGNFRRECGKKFLSSRALAGHMRTHSTLYTKNKCGHLCNKCGRSFDSMKALFGHMKIHSKRYRTSTESDDLSEFEFYHPKKKRSITRYRTSQTFSFSSVKESASINEIDEAAEEAANSLIMLSMGLKGWDGFNSQPESSSNANSSASCDKNITKIDADVKRNWSEIFCSLDKKTEQETHFDGPSSFQLDDKKINRPDNESGESPIEPGNNMMTDLEVMRSKEHECQICFKVFPTGRALGGHKRAHYNGSIGDRIKNIMVDIQDLGDIQPILDLNLAVIPHRDIAGLMISN